MFGKHKYRKLKAVRGIQKIRGMKNFKIIFSKIEDFIIKIILDKYKHFNRNKR